MNNVIRLSKITKILGWITTILFAGLEVAILLAGQVVIGILFLPFVAIGVALILAYKKQTIIVNEEDVVFNYLIKKSQRIRYEDIRCILMIPLNGMTQAAIIDKDYNRITTLDLLLVNYELLYLAFEKNKVEILDFGAMVEEKQDVSKFVPALKWIERNHYKSMYEEDETITNLSKTESKDEIAHNKKVIKRLGWALIIADLVAIFLGGTKMIAIFIAVLLLAYSIYIRYYPYIFTEVMTKKGQEDAYQLPFLGGALAFLMCLNVGRLFNYDFVAYMKMVAITGVLLAVPFLLKSRKVQVHQRFVRKLSVVCMCFMLAFTITFPLNFVLTTETKGHNIGIVVDKRISSGNLRSKNIYVAYNGQEIKFTVPSDEYKSTSIGSKKKICLRRSMLGLEYSTLHD